MIVYSLDPGVTSGYCIVDLEFFGTEGGKEFRIIGILEQGTFKYPEGALRQLHKARVADVIIIEDFILRKNLIGDRLITVRVIGAFECFFHDKVVFQQPSEKARVNDAILKKNNVWSQSAHTKDALRHLLIWAYKKRGRTLRQNLQQRRLNGESEHKR